MLLPQYIDKFRCLLTQCELRHAIGVLNTFSFFADDAHLDNLEGKTSPGEDVLVYLETALPDLTVYHLYNWQEANQLAMYKRSRGLPGTNPASGQSET